MARKQTITTSDQALLDAVRDQGPLNVYQLAKVLDRPRSPVYRQVQKLSGLGLLSVDGDGKLVLSKTALIPGTQVPQAGDPVPAETKPETIPSEELELTTEPEPEPEMEVKMIDHSAVKDVEKICAEMTAKYPANAWDIYVAIRDLGPLTLEEIEYVTGESRFYIGYICLQLAQKGILLRGQYVDEFWGPVPEDPADLPAAREAMGRKWQELELKKRRKDVQQTNEKFRGQSWYSEVPLPTNVLPYPENFVVSSW